MSSKILKVLFLSCALMGLSGTASAQMAGDIFAMAPIMPQSYKVELNKTQLIRLHEPAGAVVVGNPAIADVSVHSDKAVFIIGRGYGETNIMVLSPAGDVVMDASVQVANDLNSNGIRVYRGSTQERSTYSCAPYCIPAPVLGDAGEFIANNQGTSVTISNQVANTAGVASSTSTLNEFSQIEDPSASGFSANESAPGDFP